MRFWAVVRGDRELSTSIVGCKADAMRRRLPTTIRRVTDSRAGFDVEGPVQAEVFVVWLNGDHLELTGPDGADRHG